jgi:16S rRNA C967 or C1407 C5-methylase (RsmB/RsmF family)
MTTAEDRPYHHLNERLKKTYYLDEASYIAALNLQASPGNRILDLCAAPRGERTEHGRQIWPDRTGGRGPIYFSRIRKLKPEG